MYKYEDMKDKLFTDAGQKIFLRIRDKANKLLDVAGAFKLENVYQEAVDSWLGVACIDRMVELGEIREIKQEDIMTQERIFVRMEC